MVKFLAEVAIALAFCYSSDYYFLPISFIFSVGTPIINHSTMISLLLVDVINPLPLDFLREDAQSITCRTIFHCIFACERVFFCCNQ